MKNKIIKFFLSVIIFFSIVFIINTIRNIIILKNIERLQSNYSQTDNHYEKIENDLQNIKTEYYYKDGKSKMIMNRKSDLQTVITTYDGKYKNLYIDNNGIKIAILNDESDIMSTVMLIKLDFSGDFGRLFYLAATSFISTEKINEKEYYVARGYNWIAKDYFDKETGLLVKRIDKNGGKTSTTIYEYFFNNVIDSDLEEPDITHYKIQ